MKTLYRFTLPSFLAPILAGAGTGRVITAMLMPDQSLFWLDTAFGFVAIWSLISWRWRFVVERRERDEFVQPRG